MVVCADRDLNHDLRLNKSVNFLSDLQLAMQHALSVLVEGLDVGDGVGDPSLHSRRMSMFIPLASRMSIEWLHVLSGYQFTQSLRVVARAVTVVPRSGKMCC